MNFNKCPWGCEPKTTIKTVPGPEPAFPDREKPVVFCKHARIEGKKGLFVSDEAWNNLAQEWNSYEKERDQLARL